ncbi:MAG: hypothetical protein ACNA7G_12790 [Methylobacter sp.]
MPLVGYPAICYQDLAHSLTKICAVLSRLQLRSTDVNMKLGDGEKAIEGIPSRHGHQQVKWPKTGIFNGRLTETRAAIELNVWIARVQV